MTRITFLENGIYDQNHPKHDFKCYGCRNQSNFIRIQEMYNNDLEQFRYSFLRLPLLMTIAAMKTIYAANGYIRTTWRCGISWTEKELKNHSDSIGYS
jgi:threonine synthase